MINKQKIRIMTNLAIYDKNIGIKDKEKSEILQFDYVYKSNFWARISAFFGCLIVLAFYVIKLVLVDQIDLFNYNYKAEATKIIYYVVAVLIFYTVINGIIANIDYMKSQKRLEKYYKLLDVLDGKVHNAKPAAQEDTVRPAAKIEREKEDYSEYGQLIRRHTDLDTLRTTSIREEEPDDDEIPANKYPDVRPRTRTPRYTAGTRHTPVPRSNVRRAMPQSKSVLPNRTSLGGYGTKPTLSANKGAVKGKDGKYTSD